MSDDDTQPPDRDDLEIDGTAGFSSHLEGTNLGEDEPKSPTDTSTVDFGDSVDPLDADPPEPDADRDGTPSSGTDAPASRESSTLSESGFQSADPLSSEGAVPDSVDASRDRDRADGESTERTVGEGGGASTSFDADELLEDTSSERADGARGTGATTEPAPEVLDQLAALEEAVDRQSDRIEAQQRTIEQLIEELRQGR